METKKPHARSRGCSPKHVALESFAVASVVVVVVCESAGRRAPMLSGRSRLSALGREVDLVLLRWLSGYGMMRMPMMDHHIVDINDDDHV